MTPQTGDIWEWTRGDDDGPILIIEYLYEETSHGEKTKHYTGLDLLTGDFDDFIFNDSNLPYWQKVA